MGFHDQDNKSNSSHHPSKADQEEEMKKAMYRNQRREEDWFPTETKEKKGKKGTVPATTVVNGRNPTT